MRSIFAREVLEGQSRIVNWADQDQRQNFLRERRHVAESLEAYHLDHDGVPAMAGGRSWPRS
jgi:hypothetical protein